MTSAVLGYLKMHCKVLLMKRLPLKKQGEMSHSGRGDFSIIYLFEHQYFIVPPRRLSVLGFTTLRLAGFMP